MFNVTIIEQKIGDRQGQEAGIGFGDVVNELDKKYDATGLQEAIQNNARRIIYYQQPDGLMYRLLRANFDGLPSADLLIGADRIHSTIRQLVGAPTGRYAGYVSLRGTINEQELSRQTCEYFSDYVVPTDDRNFTPGERLINFVWYYNIADSSAEMNDVFSDINRKHHRKTVPVGLVRLGIWEKVRGPIQIAEPFAEVLAKVKSPFVTNINDSIRGCAYFYDDKVVLVGDAFASFRPHVAAATEQCAYHSNSLERVYVGQKTHETSEDDVRRYARQMILLNRIIGYLGRSAFFSLFKSLTSYIIFVLWQKLGRRKVP
ncbi:FAD binding domain protein [Xylaria bambusicola]|uniref:FAD binding domain protein n=1 Tax=Xylaria bambusicola TaxID=326684 RepID=UPI002007B065|nr:FAD binding domain protein [Xylaria bambusicola]KAI0516706.1 FAD binding domain protein [Xylaria bambusicola]